MLPADRMYCFLDFETTWLSHIKDDIIQVGLIITDSKLSIQSSWSSFVNPGYEITKLKTIVSYATGITIEQIQWGISLDTCIQHIRSLLPDDCIFVWQNILFDLKFLVKYDILPSSYLIPSSHRFIDTIEPAKALIHYSSSYSLDILYPLIINLYGEQSFLNIASQVWRTNISNHDALSDCIICIGMMRYFIQKITTIISSFPSVEKILRKAPIWYIQPSSTTTLWWWSKIPLLDFPVKPSSSTIIDHWYDRSTLPNHAKLYYGNLPIEQLIRKITGIGKVIIATNSKSKLLMIKSTCKRMGLHSISFAKEQQQVSKEKLNRIYSKPLLEEYEWRFLIKYCSHKLQWLGLLDLNTPWDYKIYNYIREDAVTNKTSMILVTHSGLFSLIEQGEYTDYTLCFLDQERWYNSYLKYTTTPRDPVNFSRILDNYCYAYKNDNQKKLYDTLSILSIQVDIFCGILSIELEKVYHTYTIERWTYKELWVIHGQRWFEKTTELYERVESTIKSIETEHHVLFHGEYKEDRKVIRTQYEKYQLYMNSIVQVSAILSDYISYTFTIANKFVEYSEFMETIKEHRTLFFSNRNTTREALGTDALNPTEKKHFPCIIEHPLWVGINDKLTPYELWSIVYIMNNNTTIAKKLFEELIDRKQYTAKDTTILVENITGWRGKCLALAKYKKPLVMVWWYEMLLQMIQEKISPSKIIIYGEMWLLHHQIVQDVNYWME